MKSKGNVISAFSSLRHVFFHAGALRDPNQSVCHQLSISRYCGNDHADRSVDEKRQ